MMDIHQVKQTEYRLDEYESLDQLRENVPEELFDAITRYLKGEDVEFLDI